MAEMPHSKTAVMGTMTHAAENAANETVAVDRLQVDTYKWYAGKLNDAYDARRQDVSVNISIQDLHAQAAELLEQEMIDVTPEEKDDG